MKSLAFNRIGTFLFCISLGAASSTSFAADELRNTRAFIQTQDYQRQTIEGWEVRVNKELLTSQKTIGDAALLLLAQKLREIRNVVPSTALTKIMRVPIWLGIDDYAVPNASYHPSSVWLKDHGWNPDKAKSVEIGNAQIFIEWSTSQPMLVLHELAHAYHDQILGYGHHGLLFAYEQAKASGKYESVTLNGKLVRAYALTNFREFFAEATEAYFGRNDYFPTTRNELFAFDPLTYRAIEKAWGIDSIKPDASDKP